MSLAFLLAQPFARHALLAAALVAVSCGLIGPFVVTRGMSSPCTEPPSWPFTGAAAGLIVAGNPVAGALAGSLVVAALIATLGARPRERDSAIGAIPRVRDGHRRPAARLLPGHHAKWRELTEQEETAAVAEFRALAGGRPG